MFNKNIKDLFNKTKIDPIPLSVDRETLKNADAALIVDPENQPGIWGKFMLQQSGGGDPHYYTKGEANRASALVGLKFASVSLATYSFMKMVAPAFHSGSILHVPSLGNVDTRMILMGTASGLVFWMIAKLDTVVMSNIRTRRIAEEIKAEKPDASGTIQKAGFFDYASRLGISFGSLMISVPALLVTAAQPDLEKSIRDELYTNNNKSIVEEYQDNLSTIEKEIKRLVTLRVNLESQERKIDTEGNNLTYSEDQLARKSELEKTLLEAEKRLVDQQTARIDLMKIINSYETESVYQNHGLNGAIAGKGQEYYTALANLESTQRDVAIIDTDIVIIKDQILNIKSDVDNIYNSALENFDRQKSSEDNLRENLKTQIDQINTDIEKQEVLRQGAQNPTGNAENDPRYQNYSPDMASLSREYVERVLKNADPITLIGIAGLTLMIAAAELGVFVAARTRKVSVGEKKSYYADMIKSRSSADIYDRAMERIKIVAEGSVDEELVHLRQKVRILEQNEGLFKDALEQMKNDPEFREKILKEVLKDAERYRYKSEETKMSDVSDSTVVKNDIGENTEPSGPKEEKPEPKPQMI